MATFTGTSGGDSFSGGNDPDTIFGFGGSDTFDGGAGDDLIVLAPGGTPEPGPGSDGLNDTVDGGLGTDTLVLSGGFSTYTVSFVGVPATDFVLSSGGTTETVRGVEIVTFADGNVRLVGAGGYATIQAAVNAAADGDIILIAPGTYAEQVAIEGKSNLTLLAIDPGSVIIQAPADVDATGVDSFGYDINAVVAVIDSDNVVLRNIDVDGAGVGNTISEGAGSGPADFVGVFYRNSSGGLEAVNVTGVRDPLEGGFISGLQRGFGVIADNGGGDQQTFFMDGGSIVDFQKGAAFFENVDLDIDGVVITGGGDQPIQGQNGIQAGNSTGTIQNAVITGLGYSGPATDTYGAGLYLYGNVDLDVLDNTITGANGSNADTRVFGMFVVGGSGGAVTGNTITGVDRGIDVSGDIGPVAIDVSGNTVTVDATDPYAAGLSFDPTETSTVAYDVSGTAINDILYGAAAGDTLSGGAGEDVIDGRGGVDSMSGGEDDDTYTVDDEDDLVVELEDEGTDAVFASVSHTLAANVENLTLTDLAENLETFEDFDLGAIGNGENGWAFVGGPKDQAVVAYGGGQGFQMSSDPSVGDFSGPYTPELELTAGESTTSADADTLQVTFTFQAVAPGGDNSRLEVDFATAARTDRNNFMVIESTAAGLRIAVADALPNGTFDTGAGIGDFTAFTGNRTLISGVDASVAHELTMVVQHVDGADNDVISFYLDGDLIGTSTTFENYRDFIGGTHETNAEANQSSGLFFRGSAAGAPQDGPGGQNQGFIFDDIQYSVYDSGTSSGTGNDLDNVITGNSQHNLLSGEEGEDILNGGVGDDSLEGGEGADALNGGTGTDTAVYTGSVMLASAGGGWTASAGAEGADVLSDIERVESAEGTTLLVGAGGYPTIQAAIDAASEGDTILIAAGTYAGNITVDVDGLTIIAEDGAVLMGTFQSSNGFDEHVDIELRTATSYSGAAGAGLTVTADDVTIRGLKIDSYLTGVELGNGVDGLTLDDVTIEDTVNGIRKGTAADVTNLTIQGGLISHSVYGVNVAKANSAAGVFDGVVIDGTAFENLMEKGIYVEALSNASITDITMTDVGEFGRGPAFGGTGANTSGFGAGIDINLKYGDYENITIDGFTFTDVGSSDGDGSAHPFGGAITVKARDDAPAYNTVPATFDGAIVITNGTITGTSTAIRAGEPTKTISDPAVEVSNVTVDGEIFDFDNVTQSVFTATGGEDAENILTNPAATGDFSIDAGGGNDIVATGAGDDTIDGGEGADSVSGGTGDDLFLAELGDVVDGGADFDTALVADVATGLALNAVNVEIIKVEGALETDPDTFIVQEGMSIQDAIDAAEDGDTIVIGEGVYTEQLTIEGRANLTIQAADGATVTVRSPADQAVNGVSDYYGINVRAVIAVSDSTNIDLIGIDVDGEYAGDTTPGSNGDELSGVAYLRSSGDLTDVDIADVGNSPGGGLFGLQHGSGLFIDGFGATTAPTVTTSGVDVSGFQKTGILILAATVDISGGSVTATATANTLTAQNGIQIGQSQGSISGVAISAIGYAGGGVYSAGIIAYEPTGALNIEDNVITGVAGTESAGLDLSDVESGVTVTVSGNTFDTLQFGVVGYTYDATVGLDSNPAVSDNTFLDIADLGFDFDPEAVFGPGGGTFTTSTAFSLTGSGFADSFAGSAGADSFAGGAGADTLTGRGGSDTLRGGAGVDSLIGGAGDDTYQVDEIGDSITELSGVDTVETTLSSYTLVDGLENLTYVGAYAGGVTFAGTGTNAANVLTGSGGSDNLVGAKGVDTLIGGEGADTLDGGKGADLMQGGLGNDRYIVDSSSDIIDESGGDGLDTASSGKFSLNLALAAFDGIEDAVLSGSKDLNLTGDEGDNKLTGNSGANRITGGLGVDILTGGSGSDIFDFNSAAEAGSGVNNRDRIQDFTQLVDLIDVFSIDARQSAAGNNAFTWIGNQAFGFGGSSVEGQLRFFVTGNGNTVVQGNTDGNASTIEFEIELKGVFALIDGDFLL